MNVPKIRVTLQEHKFHSEDFAFYSTSDYEAKINAFCEDGDLTINENDCTTYYECVHGQYQLRLCEYGTFFNPETKCCRSDYKCPKLRRSIENQQQQCNHGDVFPDENDCTKYYICIGDENERRLERRTCPKTKRFDSKLNHCVNFDYRNGLLFNRNFADDSCTESSEKDGYREDPYDNNRYYQCAQGRWIHMNCPPNLVWNPDVAVCDWKKINNNYRKYCL
ncbi:unnamed protein product [Dracunculus medinensis]|uniref:Chitin-binding type-2 domain-containing protein n=1 Tax=Dracunculus medinensis TaxID=318479 RepID=A0A0N4UJN7_DRAME|nr:unnamed protein product [Dracunculus medinensis]